MKFVELLARSNFSFLMGASHPDEMVNQAQMFGYQGLGLCDLNGLYGVARGYREVNVPSHFEKKNFTPVEGFRFHVGAEMTLPEGNVCLLPMNKKGYGQLCRLITVSKRPAPKGFSSLQDSDIFMHSEGLLACVLPPWNEKRLEEYRRVFGDRLYLPVHRDFTWESHVFVLQAFELEKRGYRLFATQRPLFHQAFRKKLHDVLVCLYHKKTLREASRLILPNAQRRLHSLEDLETIWSDRLDLVQETLNVSDRLNFSLKEISYRYPQSFLPAGKTSADFLRELCLKGLERRFQGQPSEKSRGLMEKELQLISELKYEDYFLTLWEICQFAQSQGILFQGRGSAANSIVCFLLGITAVDPQKIDLLFERFISKERNEPPDIDVDFEHERREEVIQHIYQKYGSERAGMVCNVICYRAKLAIREICKVLEIPETTVSEMVRFMGREGFQRLVEHPEMFEKWKLSPALFQEVVELVSQLRGFPKHLGIHSGGFVISEDCLLESVPVEKATMEGRFVVQWNKDDVETLGLMKLDLLSLGMLTALRKCLDLLRSHKQKDWQLYEIPPEDEPTYDMICKADTVGVFQIESRAQMSLLPRLKPRKFYDLVVEVAIVRPGPIQGGMIHPYLKRREGIEKPFYPHPALIPILKKTEGVPLFQEQIMQILISVAGFTPGESDQMRRIMSNAWRKTSQMEGLKARIYKGLRANNIPESYIEGLYKTIEGFANYGFPESHAASFALLTYASCYIKRHFPDVFACALLNSQPMGFYSSRALVMDAQRHGVRFLPLSVQFSESDYVLEGDAQKELHAVRVGLRAMSGFPAAAVDRIVEVRHAGGPFRDLTDFVRRTQLKMPVLLKLAQAGALQDLGLSAREALWRLPAICLDGESLFFAQKGAPEAEWHPPRPSEWEELSREYETQGFSLDRHPVKLLRPHLHRLNHRMRASGNPRVLYFCASKDLEKIPNGRTVRFVGLLSVQQKPPTSKGVSFLTLEDEHGFFNVVLMPKIYEKHRLMIPQNPLLEVFGRLEKVSGVYNIIATEVRPAAGYLKEAGSEPQQSPSPDMIRPRMFH